MQENEYPGNGTKPAASDAVKPETAPAAETAPANMPAPKIAPAPMPPRAIHSGETVRRSAKKAAACFGGTRAAAPMVAGLIFLLLLGMSAVFLCDLLWVILSRTGAPGFCFPLAVVLSVLVFLWFGMPAAFGRMRLSGLFLTGRQAAAAELLHYYRPALLCRSFVLSLIHLVTLFAPLGAAVGCIMLSRRLFVGVLLPALGFGKALLIFVALAALSLLLGAILFVLSNLLYFTAGFAVGNEQMPLRAAIRASARTGAQNLRTVTTFRIQNMIFIFLSLLTVGVLYVLYFAHRIQLTYLDLCMTLKGDSE